MLLHYSNRASLKGSSGHFWGSLRVLYPHTVLLPLPSKCRETVSLVDLDLVMACHCCPHHHANSSAEELLPWVTTQLVWASIFSLDLGTTEGKCQPKQNGQVLPEMAALESPGPRLTLRTPLGTPYCYAVTVTELEANPLHQKPSEMSGPPRSSPPAMGPGERKAGVPVPALGSPAFVLPAVWVLFSSSGWWRTYSPFLQWAGQLTNGLQVDSSI